MLTNKKGEQWSYEGQVDENGVACGIGTASMIETRKTGRYNMIYEGGFVNDKWEGVGVLKIE